MVSPVTGPYTKLVDGEEYLRVDEFWRQAKPIDRPLPYKAIKARRWASFGDPVGAVSAGQWATNGNIGLNVIQYKTGPVKNQAYEKFRGKLSDRADLGTMLAEMRQSLSMMETRLLQLVQFTRSARRGDVSGMHKALGLKGNQKSWTPPRNTAKRVANGYLEFHFGWSPLVQDIYNACDVLQSPINDQRIRARSRELLRWEWSTGSPDIDYHVYKNQFGLFAEYGADVGVNNPNLWLLNQLGLLNPLSVAWELVPYSFVVDWFFNVGTYISASTDLYGLTVKNAYTTEGGKAAASHVYTFPGRYEYGYNPPRRHTDLYQGATVWRRLGISTPGLVLKPLRLWGWRRCAAAASLLTQLLPPARGPR